MKRLEGLLITLPVVMLALIVAVASIATMGGCQTTQTLPDGTKVTTTDMQATAAGIQLAMTALEQGFALWQQVHPQATPEERAAEQARKDAKQAQLQALLERLLAGSLTPKSADVAKSVIVAPKS